MVNVKKQKGCVYFFKHIGLTPIKIGYSTNESPMIRFEAFKTYAPYGAELIGFIRTLEAKELETLLHEKFLPNRINGEWFEITIENVNSIIEFYSNIEDIKEKNEFQIAWAKKCDIKSDLSGEELFFSLYSLEKNETFTKQEILQKSDLWKFLTKEQLNNIMDKYKIKLKSYRTSSSSVKNGLRLFSK